MEQEVPGERSADNRLDSWKEIAGYLRRDVRTVQRWESAEGLPVHRHPHQRRSSVYAYPEELDRWWTDRKLALESAAGRSSASWRWVLAAVLVAAAIACAVWLVNDPPRAAQIRTYPLTALPGVEMAPAFSPDGSRIAYAWNRPGEQFADIYVKVLGQGDPLQVTATPDAWEGNPAWSRDGRWLAFAGTREGHRSLLIAPSIGGPERRIEDPKGAADVVGGGFCWSPDGRTLITSYAKPSSQIFHLYGVDLASGTKWKLLEPPPQVSDMQPSISTDGRTLAFLRIYGFGMARQIHTVALGRDMRVQGSPVPLAQASGSVESLSWVRNERRITYLAGCCSSGVTVGFWEVRTDRRDPPKLLFPISGAQGILGAVSPDASKLAYHSSQTGNTGFWKLRLGKGPATESPVEELPSSTATNLNPALSPDGQRLAFASSRSGPLEIWTSRLDGTQAQQVTNTNGAKCGSPRWSPDGRRIAFNLARGKEVDIYVVNSDGGAAIRLTRHAGVEHDPSWSTDGQWIYFASARTGRDEIWKIPAAGGTETQLTRNGGFGGYESPDSRFFYYATEYAGGDLRRVPTGGGREETLVSKIREVHDVRMTAKGVYYLASCPECNRLVRPHVLYRLRHADGKVEEVARFRLAVRMGFSVAPDDSYVIINGLREAGGRPQNITIVEGLR